MTTLPKKNLVLSLIFPAIIFCAGMYYFIKQLVRSLSMRDDPIMHWLVFAVIVLGGVLPAVLTTKLNIDTSEYLAVRLRSTVLIFIADTLISQRGINIVVAISVSVLCAAELFYQLLEVQDDWTTGGERAVLMLSDPIFYYSAYILTELYV